MKFRILSIVLLSLLFAACSQKQVVFNVSNKSDIDLIAKSIKVKRADLEAKFGELKEQKMAYLVDQNGVKFAAQLDDTRGDGKWDMLFAQVDLKAGQTATFTIDWLADDLLTMKPLTNIRFAEKSDASKELIRADRLKNSDTETTQTVFQFEGPGWENDVVGFRNYFDARNGIDIWGKTTSEMVLDGVGIEGAPSYHEIQDWGMDILKVGNSLGAGSIALQSAGKLYQIGPGAEGTYKQIVEGPLRSVLEFKFDRINIEGRLISVSHRICIEAGKPFYKSMVNVDDAGDAKLVAGIVNLHSNDVYYIPSENVSYFFTHDKQAYNGEMLGMAIIVPNRQIEVFTAPEEGEGITQTYYTTFDISSQIEFFFMAGWELQDPKYATFKGFEAELDKQAEQIAAKVEVVI
ncbi:MAG TPA: DUF4861 domain-containing protein [Prolixibacteraceae bacterium]|nr:DUF4861 domain-containing protein [Prolixibacteraceae bacterium]